MPIWDQFLTEQDKQLLRQAAKKEPRGFGNHPALLVIDAYYRALGDRPLHILESVKAWPSSCGMDGWEAIYKTQDLLKAARTNGIPVVYSTSIDDFPSPWHRGSKRKLRYELPEGPHRIQSQIVDEVKPQPDELIVRKAAPSAFYGTPLLSHLIYLGVDTVITCGETTSGCVRATVVDGCSHRFSMGVVQECTFDRIQASHAINLFDMNQKYADVVTLEEAVNYFNKIG
ncbi:isochorismatase family protein [Chloroflexota bacterium]